MPIQQMMLGATPAASAPNGRSALSMDGSDDWIILSDSDDYYFGTGNWTVEAFVRSTASWGSWNGVVGQWPNNNAHANNNWVIEAVSGSIRFYYMNSTGGVSYADGPTLNEDGWYHICFQRISGTIYTYVSGWKTNTHSIAGDGNTVGQNPSSSLTIGGGVTDSGSQGPWTGYISNVRIIKGSAYYVDGSGNALDSFAMTKDPLESVSGTVLLCANDPDDIYGGTKFPTGTTFSKSSAPVTTQSHSTTPFFIPNKDASTPVSFDVWPTLLTSDITFQTVINSQFTWDPYGSKLATLLDLSRGIADKRGAGNNTFYYPSTGNDFAKSSYSYDNQTSGIYGQPGWYAQMAYYDGTDDYLRTDSGGLSSETPDMNLGTEDWTVESYVRLTSDNTVDENYWGTMMSIAWEGGSNTNSKFWTGIAGGAEPSWGYDDKEWHVNLKSAGGTIYNLGSSEADSGYQTTTLMYNDHQWHHIAVSHEKSANKYRFYIDGVKRKEVTFTGGLNTSTGTLRMYNFGYDHSNNGTIVGFLKGYQQDYRVYNGACKYTDDVLKLFGWGSWMVNSYYSGADRSLDFEGSSDYVLGTGDFTIEFWFKSNGLSNAIEGDANIRMFMLDQAGNGASTNFQFLIVHNSRRVRLYGDDSLQLDANAVDIDDSSWHHIAAVRESGTLSLYIDGASRASVSSGTYNYGSSANSGSPRPRVGAYASTMGRITEGSCISNLRIVVGTAIYTGSYTVPTEDLEDTSGCKLLACQGPSPIYASVIASGTKATTEHSQCGASPFYG